ncbi:uncharacterized protein B0H18DRAFT_960965 [Fomitopsis serialis]|uniref:uncharacterized protein n=1 Tax=Fomitopsis serialis TaxID=139415 RepID=UPI002007D137|nr:uncharacterized protein B0H18DRAFT_960965 [Neoantrodia serialis]KAH9912539.1 hypothetical protein B0H18DRAFT_960965 [Neoantrodia serialis]
MKLEIGELSVEVVTVDIGDAVRLGGVCGLTGGSFGAFGSASAKGGVRGGEESGDDRAVDGFSLNSKKKWNPASDLARQRTLIWSRVGRENLSRRDTGIAKTTRVADTQRGKAGEKRVLDESREMVVRKQKATMTKGDAVEAKQNQNVTEPNMRAVSRQAYINHLWLLNGL